MQVKTQKGAFDVTPEQDVEIFLTITVGNAQIGGSIIKYIDSPTIAKGDIQNLDLGKGSDLIGKTLSVVTNVLDVNEQTNGIVVTYFFSSAAPAVITVDDKVDDDGDVCSFELEFNFK